MRKIKDLVFVITGASSGIGRGTALEVARQGGKVVLAGREKATLKEVAAECQKLGARALPVPTDVTDERATQRLAREAYDTFGRIDVWVNNAGASLFGRFEQTPPESFQKVIETNLFGYINCARAVLPYFRQREQGVLINHSSVLSKIGMPYLSAYAASNFGIRGWAESLRMELLDAPNIHVCTLIVASVDTPLFQHAANYTGRAAKPTTPIIPPEKVVAAILKCALHPKREIQVGSISRPAILSRILAPGMAEKMIPKQVEKDHFIDEPPARREGNLFRPMHEVTSVEGDWRPESNGKKTGAAAATGLAVAAAGAAAWLFKSGPKKVARQPKQAAATAKAKLKQTAAKAKKQASRATTAAAPKAVKKRPTATPAKAAATRKATPTRAKASATKQTASRQGSPSRAKTRPQAATARRAAATTKSTGTRSRTKPASRSRRS